MENLNKIQEIKLIFGFDDENYKKLIERKVGSKTLLTDISVFSVFPYDHVLQFDTHIHYVEAYMNFNDVIKCINTILSFSYTFTEFPIEIEIIKEIKR